MPEAPKARSAPRGGLRVRIGVVLGLAALQALRGRQLRRPKGREAPDQSRDLPVSAEHRWSAALVTPLIGTGYRRVPTSIADQFWQYAREAILSAATAAGSAWTTARRDAQEHCGRRRAAHSNAFASGSFALFVRPAYARD